VVTVRQVLARLHRYLGLTTAVFLVIAGLTGSVIAFHGELDAWLNPNLFYARAGDALSPSELIARIEASDPRIQVAFVEVNVKRGRSVMLYVEPRPGITSVGYNQVFADPASGGVLGRRQYGACCFQHEALIPFLYNLHRRLTMPDKWGDWLMGAIALFWLVDCFIALMIAVPRRPLAPRRWRRVLGVRFGSSRFRAIFDLHRAGGVWLWMVLTLVALSSVYLNLGDAIVRPVVGMVSPLAPSPFDRREAAPRQATQSFDDILARSTSYRGKLGANYSATGIYFDRQTGIYVTDFDTEGEFKFGFAWVAFDAASGEPIANQRPGEGSKGDSFLQLQLPLHSGRIGGWTGRIVISFTGLMVAVLSITGIVIWWRKRRAWTVRSV
jgi:uncharacterized iron-regulated membrane protein